MALSLDELQRQVGDWHVAHFPHAVPTRLVLKLSEEVGELSSAHNKRLSLSEHLPWHDGLSVKEQDAVGDVVIVLLALCDRAGLSLSEIVTATWREVSARSAERIGK